MVQVGHQVLEESTVVHNPSTCSSGEDTLKMVLIDNQVGPTQQAETSKMSLITTNETTSYGGAYQGEGTNGKSPGQSKAYDAGSGGEGSTVCSVLLTILSVLVCVCTFPFSLLFIFKVIKQYEKAVIFRLGCIKSGGASGPGLFTFLPCIDSIITVDMRTVSFDVPPQEILTKDSVTVRVDAVVYYRIRDAVMSVCNIDDVKKSTRLLAMTTLRNTLGMKTLAEILSHREEISASMQNVLDTATDPWGVQVERVEVKDVSLPISLQRAMAAEAEAQREAKAKVIAAEGELNASKALKEAADVIAANPTALQLRYLQTLTTIATEQNSTIMFPMPIDMMKAFLPGSK